MTEGQPGAGFDLSDSLSASMGVALIIPPAQLVLFGPAGVLLLALSSGLSLNQTLGSVAA